MQSTGSTLRSKSQKKKDIYANLIAEAQDNFGRLASGQTNLQSALQNANIIEKTKIKKVNSYANLHAPSISNKVVAKVVESKSTGKRLIFQGVQ